MVLVWTRLILLLRTLIVMLSVLPLDVLTCLLARLLGCRGWSRDAFRRVIDVELFVNHRRYWKDFRTELLFNLIKIKPLRY